MKEDKWFNRILGNDQKEGELKHKDRRLEVYELFKKNKYKTKASKDDEKRNE